MDKLFRREYNCSNMNEGGLHLHQYVKVKGWGDNLFQVVNPNGRHPLLHGVESEYRLTPPANLIRPATLAEYENRIFFEK